MKIKVTSFSVGAEQSNLQVYPVPRINGPRMGPGGMLPQDTHLILVHTNGKCAVVKPRAPYTRWTGEPANRTERLGMATSYCSNAIIGLQTGLVYKNRCFNNNEEFQKYLDDASAEHGGIPLARRFTRLRGGPRGFYCEHTGFMTPMHMAGSVLRGEIKFEDEYKYVGESDG